MRPDPIFRSLLVLPRIDGRRMARGAERGRRIMKTRGFGRRDDQVLPAQEAGAGAGLPAVAGNSPPHSSHLNGTTSLPAIAHL